MFLEGIETKEPCKTSHGSFALDRIGGKVFHYETAIIFIDRIFVLDQTCKT
jgi:hypothetical protein